jgi:hypothetical protein
MRDYSWSYPGVKLIRKKLTFYLYFQEPTVSYKWINTFLK